MPEYERRQLLLIDKTPRLDFSCVDYLRERDGGAPVFHDVNVYPTVVGAWQGARHPSGFTPPNDGR